MTKARDIADFKFENIVDTGTEGTRIATGTTAQRGSTTGQLRFNNDLGLAEYYTGTQFKAIDAPPVVSSLDVTEVDSQAGGNQTIVITGSGFSSGATVTFVGNAGTDFNASTVTVDSNTQITAVAPKASFLNAQEPYGVKVQNVSGLSATLASQINVDTSPSWQTASGNLGSVEEGSSANFSVSATDPDGDTVSYSETTSVLSGAGFSLNSSTGAITGTASAVTGDTTDTFTLRATANSKTADRIFNIIRTEFVFDGSSSARAAGSPYQIATVTGSTPTNGIYWFSNSGYNGGTPFQAYCDWSPSNYNTNGIMILTQQAISGTPITNGTDMGTASTSDNGTKGHGNTFRSDTAGILNNWSGDTANRGIAGMYRNTSIGSDLNDTTDLNWIEFSKTPAQFKDMFDDAPSVGAHTGTISARSVGGTGSFYWSKNTNAGEFNNGHRQMHNSIANGTWNTSNYMEMRFGGSDTNHSFFVEANGNGAYANAGYNYARVGFFGFSPNNIRT